MFCAEKIRIKLQEKIRENTRKELCNYSIRRGTWRKLFGLGLLYWPNTERRLIPNLNDRTLVACWLFICVWLFLSAYCHHTGDHFLLVTIRTFVSFTQIDFTRERLRHFSFFWVTTDSFFCFDDNIVFFLIAEYFFPMHLLTFDNTQTVSQLWQNTHWTHVCGTTFEKLRCSTIFLKLTPWKPSFSKPMDKSSTGLSLNLRRVEIMSSVHFASRLFSPRNEICLWRKRPCQWRPKTTKIFIVTM